MILDRVAKPWYVWRPWQLARRLQGGWTASGGKQRRMKTAWGIAIMADPRTTIGWSIHTTASSRSRRHRSARALDSAW